MPAKGGGPGVLIAAARASSPAPLLHHLRLLDDVLPLFVLLALLEGLLVLPAQDLLAARTVDVRHGVQSSNQQAVLLRAKRYVHDIVEEIRPAVPTLEGLRHDLVMVARVASAVATTVDAGAVQILLEQAAHPPCRSGARTNEASGDSRQSFTGPPARARPSTRVPCRCRVCVLRGGTVALFFAFAPDGGWGGSRREARRARSRGPSCLPPKLLAHQETSLSSSLPRRSRCCARRARPRRASSSLPLSLASF
mmetsp:Transcript_1660/g.5663  ORF Transcript_1660/g.5663 Transcript_1660/m.5663 type:complete len:252 (+) Transcript_1660:1663-2418(+)